MKKVHFEYALVTGIGRYLKSGIVVDTGDYTSVEVMATKLDELFQTGKPNMKLNSKKTQAFDKGATAAIVHFDLFVEDFEGKFIEGAHLENTFDSYIGELEKLVKVLSMNKIIRIIRTQDLIMVNYNFKELTDQLNNNYKLQKNRKIRMV